MVHTAATQAAADNKRVRTIVYIQQLTPDRNSFPFQTHSRLMTMYIELSGFHYESYSKTQSCLSACPAIITPDGTTRRGVWIGGRNVTILQEDLHRVL